MAPRTFQRKHLFFVRWGQLTLKDLDDVLSTVRGIERAEGRKVLYAGLQYDDTPMLDRSHSRVVIERAVELATHCSMLYFGVCATGLAGSLHRTALRSLLTMARVAGHTVPDRVRVTDSVDAILDQASNDLPSPRAELRAALTAAGMP